MRSKLVSSFAAIAIISGCAGLIPIKVGPAEDVTIDSTPERLARGEYLATKVMLCTTCHAKRDPGYYAEPAIPGTEGRGGERYGPEHGFPGEMFSKNITPFGIGDWSDGELLRAMMKGVSAAGEPLFPIMPYLNYRNLDREDAYAIVAYIRTLKPIDYTPPARKLKFPVNLIVRSMPRDISVSMTPNLADTLAYGKYLTTLASCSDCHTKKNNKGQPMMDLYFAGGWSMVLRDGSIVRPGNLTPDVETGTGSWTKASFIGRFKAFDNEESRMIPIEGVQAGKNTTMPWIAYAGMTEADLGAIYTYLKSLPPVRNKVVKYASANGDPLVAE